jgi:hypothetical protein
MWAGVLLTVLGALEPAANPEPQAPACPSPDEVAAELARVGATGAPAPDIVVDAGRMRVILRDRYGGLVGSREVEAPPSCRERATVAATFVATWMGVWPAAAADVASPPRPAIAPPPPAAPRRTQLGLAVLGAHDGNAAALGLAAELRRDFGPVAAVLAASGTTERTHTVGPGRAGYRCPAVELGPAYRLGQGRWQGEVGAAARLGLLLVRGLDLAATHQKTHLVPGASAALRLVHVGERLSPFVVAGATAWFARQELTLDNDPATAELPLWDVSVGVGVDWAP